MKGGTLTATLYGVEGKLINVQVHSSSGLSNFVIVGLADRAVQEAKERVIAAIKSSGFEFVPKKVVVNLAPGHLQKFGTHFDLPISLAYLATTNQVRINEEVLILGELSLDGELRPVKGILALVKTALDRGIQNVIIPKHNLDELALISGINIYPYSTLSEVVDHFNGKKASPLSRHLVPTPDLQSTIAWPVRGMSLVKLALTIAAIGRHNVLLSGPPGCGKTLLARFFPKLLPPLTDSDLLEVNTIHNLLGGGESSNMLSSPPFRSPHHSASKISLIGGGRIPLPGEISLAHKGVLFLDELAEFPTSTIDSLRQPLEDKHIAVSRANYRVRFPADFQLIAATNLCKCGNYGSNKLVCSCSDSALTTYQRRISGPIIQRFDISLLLDRTQISEISYQSYDTVDLDMIYRIAKQSRLKNSRFNKSYNSELSLSELFTLIHADDKENIVNVAHEKFMSPRTLVKVLRVAVTLSEYQNSDCGLDTFYQALSLNTAK